MGACAAARCPAVHAAAMRDCRCFGLHYIMLSVFTVNSTVDWSNGTYAVNYGRFNVVRCVAAGMGRRC